ncbi:MAG: hypothetical protein V1710_09705, partial [Candidatus Bathyarchaeota archaeon]
VSTAVISLKPGSTLDPVEKTLQELIQQGDKYTKNALREALIRSEWIASKKEARSFIDDLKLEPCIMESWASRLSLTDLQTIEQKLRSN